jgi:hypothetical protein
MRTHSTHTGIQRAANLIREPNPCEGSTGGVFRLRRPGGVAPSLTVAIAPLQASLARACDSGPHTTSERVAGEDPCQCKSLRRPLHAIIRSIDMNLRQERVDYQRGGAADA